jgi:hypothetical protein
MPPIPVIEYLAVILAGFAAWLLGRLRPDLISNNAQPQYPHRSNCGVVVVGLALLYGLALA